MKFYKIKNKIALWLLKDVREEFLSSYQTEVQKINREMEERFENTIFSSKIMCENVLYGEEYVRFLIKKNNEYQIISYNPKESHE